ncbi:reverse transcriptase domain-containing protein [Endozoicomonas sp. SESOKO1]|uniref:reverse transcriptase domain-containing protein n=1 Tax=Endozoicomonas sp. SESOKO1 TaxID=2828742 RepID=UPI002148044C|nr:reverse transcriptase domain-containing protein [Endozoicomonas sp. SESOKO1]
MSREAHVPFLEGLWGKFPRSTHLDIQKYFDTIDHNQLRQFLARRVTDGVVRKLIDKWLKAGILESGELSYPTMGTPQGGVISPLLANIYLHYVLDDWFRPLKPTGTETYAKENNLKNHRPYTEQGLYRHAFGFSHA